MTCAFCGSQSCYGGCLQAYGAGQCIINQPQIQGQAAAQGWLQQGQPFILGGTGILGGTTVDTSLTEFLEVIADKTDTDACVAFIEKQRKIHASQVQILELLKKQHQQNLDNAEAEFLAKCLKYRPSISPEIMERVKKLKAFY